MNIVTTDEIRKHGDGERPDTVDIVVGVVTKSDRSSHSLCVMVGTQLQTEGAVA